MGRPKKELRRIHKKKVKKAKKLIARFEKGEISRNKLSQRARRLLGKKKKKARTPLSQ